MSGRYIVKFLIVICLIFALLPGVIAQQPEATTTADLNVRSVPNGTVIGTVARDTVVILEARSEDSAWALIHTPDSSLRGWISTAYINSGVNLADLPVSSEHIGAPAPQAPVSEQPPAPPGEASGTVTSQLNVRSLPSQSGSIQGQFSPNTFVVIEGRNVARTWLLVHHVDGSLRGWVAASFIRPAEGVVIANLPVLEETSNPSVGAARSLPSYRFSSRVYQIYRRGQRLGNRANAYIEIGDSVTVEEWFMNSFGEGDYDLGPYAYLQPTIDFFNETGSFTRENLTAAKGYSTFSMTDPTWANPALCEPEETLIDCEVRIHRPGVAFVYLVGNDILNFTVEDFNKYLDQIVRDLMDKGVIPVLTTFPYAPAWQPDKAPEFQQVIRNTAVRYRLPLIDLYTAVQSLPNQGVYPNEYHLTLRQDGVISFVENQYEFGATMRDLLSLQMLHDLRTQVLEQ